MATIGKRDGWWRTQIRKPGYPHRFGSFPTKAEALEWTRQIESEMDRSVFVSRSVADRTTVCARSRPFGILNVDPHERRRTLMSTFRRITKVVAKMQRVFSPGSRTTSAGSWSSCLRGSSARRGRYCKTAKYQYCRACPATHVYATVALGCTRLRRVRSESTPPDMSNSVEGSGTFTLGDTLRTLKRKSL